MQTLGAPFTPQPEDFSTDRYAYIDGLRFKVGFVCTIRPFEGETNGAFERRIDDLVRALIAKYGATATSMELQRAAGGITQCLLDVTYPPRAAVEIADDQRPAGGRVIQLRGGRGGQRQSA